MAESNPFAFTRSKATQQPSSDASTRAKLARLERENATLKQEAQKANDASGLARFQAKETEREIMRAQMAERIARKALDDLLNTHKMAQDLMASQEEVVKPEQPQVDSKEDGELQVEFETDQGLPVNTSESADDTNDVHAACKSERDELIERFGNLCRDELAKATAKYQELEAKNKTLSKQLLQLEDRLAEVYEDRKKLRDEADAKDKKLQLVATHEDELQTLQSTHFDFLVEKQQRDEEAKKRQEQYQAERQAIETRINVLTHETSALKAHTESLENELSTAHDEKGQLIVKLDYKDKFVTSLNEVNDRLRTDLQNKQQQCKALATARDERDILRVQLAGTDQDLQKLNESEATLRLENEALRHELLRVTSDTTKQHIDCRRDADQLIAQMADHENQIASRNQRIEILERDNELIWDQKESLKSQLAASRVQRPVVKDDVRPNNYRSISMASHTSLADELGFDDDGEFDGFPSDHEESVIEEVVLELSEVHYNSIIPCDVTKPQLTLSVCESMVTSPCARQDSPLEHFPVNNVRSVEPSRHDLLKLEMYNETTADFAPSQPRTSAPQKLTMHVFKQSAIKVDPELGIVCVPDHDKDRLRCSAVSSLPRRTPLNISARSSKLSDAHDLERCTAAWPVADESSKAPDTMITLSASQPTTTADIPPTSATASPFIPTMPHQEESDFSSKKKPVYLVMLILGSHAVSLPSVVLFLLVVLTALQQFLSTQHKPVSTTTSQVLDRRFHYLLHALIVPLAFFCWRFWNQVRAWEQVNGVGFGEGYGNADDSFGPYGNGHPLLSLLPLNWMSADSHLPAKAVEVITSTVSAFEGWIGLGPTPSF